MFEQTLFQSVCVGGGGGGGGWEGERGEGAGGQYKLAELPTLQVYTYPLIRCRLNELLHTKF